MAWMCTFTMTLTEVCNSRPVWTRGGIGCRPDWFRFLPDRNACM